MVTQVCQRNFESNPANAIVTGADIQYGRFLDELGLEFNQEARRRPDMIRLVCLQKNHGCLTLQTEITGHFSQSPEQRLRKIQTLLKILDIN